MMHLAKLIVAIAQNNEKEPMFTDRRRWEVTESVTFDWKNVEIDVLDGLPVGTRARRSRYRPASISRRFQPQYECQMAMNPD